MRLMTLALAVLLPLATQAQAADLPLYNAQETIRRAQVGSFSPRLAPPVRVIVPAKAGKPEPSRFERLECRRDPSRTLGNTIVCEPRRNNLLWKHKNQSPAGLTIPSARSTPRKSPRG
jgi:hypothetical protein